jgi:pyruvate dehydrogenase kinase 2/3/4
MAQGGYEFRQLVRQGRVLGTSYDSLDDPSKFNFFEHDECQAFLDRFYSSRVGIRVLAGQYLALREQLLQIPSVSTQSVSKDYIGMICKRTSPYRIVHRSIQDASRLCEDQFGFAPTVSVRGRVDLTFSYVPTHLHYIMLELIKNAMRATIEFHKDNIVTAPSSLGSNIQRNKFQRSNNIPPVTIIIADSPDNEDVVIKVCDEGGGIPRSQMSKIWSYLFTTADPDIQDMVLQPVAVDPSKSSGDDGDDDKTMTTTTGPSSPILAGLGFGLPMSRAYARYFGGDLDLISLEGYGTDAYLYLPRLTPEDDSSFHNDDSLRRIQMRRTSFHI